MKADYIATIQQRIADSRKRLTIDPLEREMVKLLAQRGPGRESKFVELVGRYIERERNASLPLAVNC